MAFNPIAEHRYGGTDFGVSASSSSELNVTNPLAPVSLSGNLTLQVTMTDKGEQVT